MAHEQTEIRNLVQQIRAIRTTKPVPINVFNLKRAECDEYGNEFFAFASADWLNHYSEFYTKNTQMMGIIMNLGDQAHPGKYNNAQALYKLNADNIFELAELNLLKQNKIFGGDNIFANNMSHGKIIINDNILDKDIHACHIANRFLNDGAQNKIIETLNEKSKLVKPVGFNHMGFGEYVYDKMQTKHTRGYSKVQKRDVDVADDKTINAIKHTTTHDFIAAPGEWPLKIAYEYYNTSPFLNQVPPGRSISISFAYENSPVIEIKKTNNRDTVALTGPVGRISYDEPDMVTVNNPEKLNEAFSLIMDKRVHNYLKEQQIVHYLVPLRDLVGEEISRKKEENIAPLEARLNELLGQYGESKSVHNKANVPPSKPEGTQPA